MALEDLAKFVAPCRPEVALKILRAFYLKDNWITLPELMKITGLNCRILRYYLGRFRGWKIVWTHLEWASPAHYSLAPSGFHARIDTKLCDPLKNLVKDAMWKQNKKSTRYISAEMGGPHYR